MFYEKPIEENNEVNPMEIDGVDNVVENEPQANIEAGEGSAQEGDPDQEENEDSEEELEGDEEEKDHQAADGEEHENQPRTARPRIRPEERQRHAGDAAAGGGGGGEEAEGGVGLAWTMRAPMS